MANYGDLQGLDKYEVTQVHIDLLDPRSSS